MGTFSFYSLIKPLRAIIMDHATESKNRCSRCVAPCDHKRKCQDQKKILTSELHIDKNNETMMVFNKQEPESDHGDIENCSSQESAGI